MSADQRISYGAIVAEVIEQLPLRCYNCSASGPCREDAARITALRELARLIERAEAAGDMWPVPYDKNCMAIVEALAAGFRPTEREQER